MAVFPANYRLPRTMYTTEDVFSWDVWSEKKPPSPNAFPTIAKGERVTVVTERPYHYMGNHWVGIIFHSRRYEIPGECLSEIPPTKLPNSDPDGGKKLKEQAVEVVRRIVGIYPIQEK